MNINWRIRFRNPVFLAQLACAIVMPLIVGMGAEWSDMTSWATLGSTVLAALGNPVVVVAMLTSVWACITDPTTSGTGDSIAALGRSEVKPNAAKRSKEE